MTQEVLQLCQGQCFITDIGRQLKVAPRLPLALLMQQLPFMGEAEQRTAFLEVTRAERLQRVLLGQRMQQLRARFLALIVERCGQAPACGQMVTQLADQHRRRTLAVVADTAADPADIELIARRQQRFEEQVSVVFSARAIARTVVAGHQVEVQRLLGTRVVAIVHAQQAHHPEWNGAHGHEGAEVYRAGEETLGQLALVQAGQPGLTHHGER
ncbi:hypothetical protein D3C71_1517150 [compost metagenome]